MEEDSRVVVDEDEVEIEGVVVVEVSLIHISFSIRARAHRGSYVHWSFKWGTFVLI